MSRLSDSLHVVAMEEQQETHHRREMSPNETRTNRGGAATPAAATCRGASHSACLRPKAKDVAMFISVGSSNTKPCQQQQQQQQPQYEQRPNPPEWLMSQTTGVTSSMSHNTTGGLLLNRCGRGGGTASTASSPTRRLSVTSGLHSRITARRITLNRQRIESRFGKARKNLSKTFNSTHLMGGHQQQMESNAALKSIATQTMEGENIAVHGGTAETSRRLSRIPVPREKLLGPRDKIRVSTRNMATAESSYSAQFALGNVYSLMTMCVSETKLEEIRSSSAISVSVRPVVEAHESCTVMDVNILRLGEVRSKEVDVDRTLENWKPTTAEVSLVPEEKPKLRTKKSIVKKDISRDKSVGRSRDKSGERSRERSTKEEKAKEERQQQVIPPPTKVAVIDLDKQAFQVPTIKSRSPSEKRSSRRSEHNNDVTTTSRNEEKNGEKRLDSPGSGSGSNFRVRFSPHLVTPAASASSSRGKFSSTKATSPVGSTTSMTKLYPGLVRRVTDQAITSIAKSVILGMPSQSRYETPHPTISFSNYRLPMPSPSYASNNYRSSFHNNYQRMPPMTMSSMNVHDDSSHMGFRFPSRNASQLSMSSLLNYRAPSTTGSVMGGMHQSGRYPYYSSHSRMSNHSMAKSRKEFDNRYSLHHHTHNSSIWDAPPQSLSPPPPHAPPRSVASRNSWVHDSGSVYNMHSGEYGTRQLGSSAPPSTSNSQNFWLRYQKMRTNRGNGPHTPAASSTSSLYTPSAIPKYDKPSQRFSLIRNHGGGGGGGGGGMRSSMENLHGHSMMSRKAMEQHGALLHRPMSMAMETGAGGLLHRPMSMEAGSLHHSGPMSMESSSHLHRPMPMESYLNNRSESSYM